MRLGRSLSVASCAFALTVAQWAPADVTTAPKAAGVVAVGELPEKPDQLVVALVNAVSDHKPQVVWEALPESYRKDVTDLVKEFAGKMDPELWNKAFTIAKKLVKVLKDKKKFIMANPLMAMAEGQVDTKALEEHWDGIIDIVGILVNSEISDLSQLKTLNVDKFLAGTGSKFMAQLHVLTNVIPDPSIKEQLEKAKGVKASLVSMEGDVAVVKLEVEGRDPEEVKLVKVDGKWIPQMLADGWSSAMSQAKDALGMISKEQVDAAKDAVMPILDEVEKGIDKLASAKTEEEFNNALQDLMSSFNF